MKTNNLLMTLSLLGVISCGSETNSDLSPMPIIGGSDDSTYTRSYRVSNAGCTTGIVEVSATSADEARNKLCDDMLERYKLNYCRARLFFKMKINSQCGEEHITAMNTWSDDGDQSSGDTDQPQNDNNDVSNDQSDDVNDDMIDTNPTLLVLTDRISIQTTIENFDSSDGPFKITWYEILLDGKKAFQFLSEDNRHKVLKSIMNSELFTNKHPEFSVIDHIPYHYGKKIYYDTPFDANKILNQMERLMKVGFFSKKHSCRIIDGNIYMFGHKALKVDKPLDLINFTVKLFESGGINQTRAIIKNGDIYIDGYMAIDFASWEEKEALNEFTALAEIGAFTNHRGGIKNGEIYLDGVKAFDFYTSSRSLRDYKVLFLAGAFLPHKGTIRGKKIYIDGVEVFSSRSSLKLFKEFLRLLEAGEF